MNINKLSKLFLATLLVTSSALFLTGCGNGSSSDDDNTIPAVPPVPTNGITGIWTGTLTWSTTGQQKDYDVTMMFHMPDVTTNEGTTGGAALDISNTDPDAQFLIEGGYSYYADPIESDPVTTDASKVICEADVWAAGRFGTKGTFLQEFDYETGSAAGPDQRGSGCLYLRDDDGDGYINELVGQIAFEDGGKFDVALTYSTDNTRAVTVSNLGTMGTDDVVYHLWSNDNSGTSMSYTSGATTTDTVEVAVVEASASLPTCGGDIKITKVANQNLFTLETMAAVAGCNNPLITLDVNLDYTGLGAISDLDDDGVMEFVHLMGSSGGGIGATAQVLYNKFIIQ